MTSKRESFYVFLLCLALGVVLVAGGWMLYRALMTDNIWWAVGGMAILATLGCKISDWMLHT